MKKRTLVYWNYKLRLNFGSCIFKILQREYIVWKALCAQSQQEWGTEHFNMNSQNGDVWLGVKRDRVLKQNLYVWMYFYTDTDEV